MFDFATEVETLFSKFIAYRWALLDKAVEFHGLEREKIAVTVELHSKDGRPFREVYTWTNREGNGGYLCRIDIPDPIRFDQDDFGLHIMFTEY